MPVTSRVVTLAQLALLPFGTMVACVKFGEFGQVDHDCQGIVQVGPVHTLGYTDDAWVNLHPVLPEIRWHEGRLEETYEPVAIMRPAFCDHRFIVYSKEAITDRKNHRARWRP